MKTTDLCKYGRLALAGLLLLAAAACDDDEKIDDSPTGGESKPLQVEQIIVQPRVAAPGDTLQCTAIVTSSSPNEGDIPVMAWTANGGTFVETNQQSVRWVAPATGGIFTLTARATNAANTDTGDANVFVGSQQALVPNNAGSVFLVGTGPDFRFFRSSNLDNGVDVSVYTAGAASDAVAPLRANNVNVVFSPDGAFEAHEADSNVAGVQVRPRHVYVGNFATQTLQGLTVDRADPASLKRHQYTWPAVSPNSQVVAYQGFLPNPDGTQPDSFHVFVHDLVAQTRTKVTAEHPFPRNFFPTFSTDGKWLTFISDQSGNGQWDLYGAPVNGNVVDGTLANLVRLTNTGGALVSGAPGAFKNPLKAWNPVSPVLAVLASDGVLYLVQTTTTGSVVTDVPGLSGVQELRWSLDGTRLAVSVGGSIVTITTAGAVNEVVKGVAGDLLRDLTWSPDGAWLLYRVTRGATCWLELKDVDAGVLTTPLAVTEGTGVGLLNAYRGVIPMNAAWTSADLIVFPVCGVDGVSLTPGIVSRDLSGAVD